MARRTRRRETMPLQSPDAPHKDLAELERDREANLFAFELLMPKEMVIREALLLRPYGFDLVDDQAVEVLSNKFVVSEQMMIIRLCQLGFFDI